MKEVSTAEVTFAMRLPGMVTVQTYEFSDLDAARAFYADRVESVETGNTIAARFAYGSERKRKGTMPAQTPIRTRTQKCGTCHQWKPESMVWNGLCQLCEEGHAFVDAEYEQKVAHFKTRKKATLFARAMRNRGGAETVSRPLRSVNDQGEKCFSIYYMVPKAAAQAA